MPTNHNGSPLEAALSFYSSIVTVNPEGDSLVSDETLEGAGTAGFLLQALFGSLLRIANPDLIYSSRRPAAADPLSASESPQFAPTNADQIPESSAVMAAAPAAAVYHDPAVAAPAPILGEAAIKRPILPYEEGAQQSDARGISDLVEEVPARVARGLTDLLPEPGYFLAGAVSGGVSRTATAPLDRLKVYLLVNTKTSTTVALAAAKHGQPLVALRNAGGPIVDAVVSLWKAGGIRTFFAGKRVSELLCVVTTGADDSAGNGLNVVKIMPESAIRVITPSKILMRRSALTRSTSSAPTRHPSDFSPPMRATTTRRRSALCPSSLRAASAA